MSFFYETNVTTPQQHKLCD